MCQGDRGEVSTRATGAPLTWPARRPPQPVCRRAPARVTLSIQTPDPARVSGPCGHKLDAVRRALHAKTGQRVQLHVRSPQSDKEAVFIVAAT